MLLMITSKGRINIYSTEREATGFVKWFFRLFAGQSENEREREREREKVK